MTPLIHQPDPQVDFPFTAVISLEPHEQGTKYTAIVIHGNQEDCKKLEEMGFYDG